MPNWSLNGMKSSKVLLSSSTLIEIHRLDRQSSACREIKMELTFLFLFFPPQLKSEMPWRRQMVGGVLSFLLWFLFRQCFMHCSWVYLVCYSWWIIAQRSVEFDGQHCGVWVGRAWPWGCWGREAEERVLTWSLFISLSQTFVVQRVSIVIVTLQ